jgi:hypothetical protein
MKEIARRDVNDFLKRHSLVLDDWNRLNSLSETKIVQILPEEYGSNLYDVACALSSWIGADENIYLFFDNSTCLMREEPVVFFRCIAKQSRIPNSVYNKIYSISKSESTSSAEHYSTLALLINFIIIYEWHVEFANGKNQILRISDGVLYLKSEDLETITEIKMKLSSQPIRLAKWQLDCELSLL